MLYNVHTPTTCMKKYPINVHIMSISEFLPIANS